MNAWFNIPAQKDQDTPAPVFTSGQAVMTFPVASALISVVWQVLRKVFPSWGSELYVPFTLALLAGAAIYFQSAPKATTSGGKVAELFFSLLNSIALAAAALGIKDVST